MMSNPDMRRDMGRAAPSGIALRRGPHLRAAGGFDRTLPAAAWPQLIVGSTAIVFRQTPGASELFARLHIACKRGDEA